MNRSAFPHDRHPGLKLRAGEGHRDKSRKTRRTFNEDDVSAEEAAEEKGTRIPQAHEDEKRATRLEAQEGQRQEIPFRLAGRFRLGRRHAQAGRPKGQEGF
jgi:hypothetical protein